MLKYRNEAAKYKFMGITGIENNLFGIEIDRALLSDDGTVELVLIQTPPPEIKKIQDNTGRKRNVDILQSLIGSDQPMLEDDLTDGALAILVFPELAFPSSAFEELDKIISRASRPLIVIAGFGVAQKDDFMKDFPSDRDGAKVALPNNGSPAPNQVLNGGWCWVHTPGSVPICIAFFKTFSEQNFEPVFFDNLWTSPCNVRIGFNDADLFPLICADILCEREDNAIKRIGDCVEGYGETGRKALVIGSLFQPETGNETWRRSMVKAVSSARLVTVNHAVDNPHHSDQKGDWRNQTGVFWEEVHGIEINNRFIREVRHDPLVGGVVRDVAACVSFGTLSWDPGEATEGRWLYQGHGHYRIEEIGLERCTGGPTVKGDIEFDFVIRHDCHQEKYPERFDSGKNEFLSNITSKTPFDTNRLLALLLYGVEANDNRPAPCDVEKHREFIGKGVNALSFLRTLGEADWGDLQEDGQLAFSTGDVDGIILVWNGPSHQRAEISKTLDIWLDDDSHHSPLLVFADGKSGTFLRKGKLEGNSRTNITTVREEEEGSASITEPRRSRRAYLREIGEIENLFSQADDIKVRGDLNTLISDSFTSMA